MKYILYPVWIIFATLLWIMDLIVYLFYITIRFLWDFKAKRSNWEWFTGKRVYGKYHYYEYDKTPFETFVRYITFGDYKHEK